MRYAVGSTGCVQEHGGAYGGGWGWLWRAIGGAGDGPECAWSESAPPVNKDESQGHVCLAIIPNSEFKGSAWNAGMGSVSFNIYS